MITKKQIKRTIWGVIIFSCIGLYFWNTVTMNVHYKITINVETPDGIVSGSAVREVKNTAYKYKLIEWSGGNPADIRGEAVVVDLGTRGVLFGLISSRSDRELYKAFNYYGGASTYKGLQYFNSLPVGEKRELKNKHDWPQMVMFKDMNDPKTVKSVADNTIEYLFDKGVSIKSVTVAITNHKITEGKVEAFLTWLPNVKKGSLDGRMGTFTTHLSSELHYGNFKKGD